MGVITVYVDVLIFVNTVVNYLILSLTELLAKGKTTILRKVCAAFFSALFSLYIFAPSQSIIFDCLVKLFSSITAVIICFKFNTLKSFLRNIGVFYATSYIYAGAMIGMYLWLKPEKLSINNSIVYFDISPLILLTFTFVIYCIISIFKKVTRHDSEFADRCTVEIVLDNVKESCTAMIDTGHTVNDSFEKGVVFIIDREIGCKLFGKTNFESLLKYEQPPIDYKKRYRVIPVKTVSNTSLLPAIRVDYVDITLKNRTHRLIKPIAVLTEERLAEDYSAIFPPEAVNF